jgi:hypothetical protein
MSDYDDLLTKAKAAGACRSALEAAAEFATFEDATKSPKAPYWACWYAYNVIRGRWPEAEATIASDPCCAYWYAHNVIKGRWPEAEATIASNPHWAHWYVPDQAARRQT